MFGFTKKCCYSWFSGFFAAPAIAHGLRLIFDWSFVIGGVSFTWTHSLVVFIVCGALSILFLFKGCKGCKGCKS